MNDLEASVEDGTPTFLASSSEVYCKPGDESLSEGDDPMIGPTTRQRWGETPTQVAGEFLALALHEEADLSAVIALIFNGVCPRQTGQNGMVIPVSSGKHSPAT